MTQQEKQLLLKDLCARLPYGVKVKYFDMEYPFGSEPVILTPHLLYNRWENIHDVKPYLRPMSSMTEDERKELCELCEFFEPYNDRDDFSHYGIEIIEEFCVNDEKIPLREINYEAIDWLNAHHFDYRGLIPRGLALEAKDWMYKTE